MTTVLAPRLRDGFEFDVGRVAVERAVVRLDGAHLVEREEETERLRKEAVAESDRIKAERREIESNWEAMIDEARRKGDGDESRRLLARYQQLLRQAKGGPAERRSHEGAPACDTA